MCIDCRKFMSVVDLSQYIWVDQTQACSSSREMSFCLPTMLREIGLRQALERIVVQLRQHDAENIDVKLLMLPGKRSEFLKHETEAKRLDVL